MTDDNEHFWDSLSDNEAKFVHEISNELRAAQWAQPILSNIKAKGGLKRAAKPFFFELRFAHELYRAGVTPEYEVEGEARSTLDFGFTFDNQKCLVELMRLEETDAVLHATQSGIEKDGTRWSQQILSTEADDTKQSEEGETIKAVERICQKCEHDGRPHKFQMPDNVYQVILVDFRTFLNGGGDVYDWIHVGLGGEWVSKRLHRRYWNRSLISGAFDPNTRVRGASELRERVHFLGFVNEKEYRTGEFARATQFVANPYLISCYEEAIEIMTRWPLQPASVRDAKPG